MTRTEALRGAGSFAVPAALVIGGSMLTLAITHAGYRPEASGPSPGPTVTRTTTASAPPVIVRAKPRSPASSSPQPSPTSMPPPAAPGTVLVAEQPAPIEDQAATGGPGNATSARPSPTPGTPPASSCSGAIAVQLPLGVLPRCALNVGGSR